MWFMCNYDNHIQDLTFLTYIIDYKILTTYPRTSGTEVDAKLVSKR